MKKRNLSTYFLMAVIAVVLYLASLVVWPYLGFIILAMVIAYATRPLYLLLKKWTSRKGLSSALMVLLVVLVLFIPSAFILKSLVSQASSMLAGIDETALENVDNFVNDRFGFEFDSASVLYSLTSRASDFLINESLSVISSIADIIIGLVISFFVLFYLFRDGEKLYEFVVDVLPLERNYKNVLFGEMQLVTNAVIYGQIVIAILQGVAGGLVFAIFGLNNPVFWGFVVMLVSFLPLVGTPVIFIPAGLIQLSHGNYVAGVGIIVFSALLTMNVDSIVKPLIISERSRLNAALILIGVLGGIKAFGFMGFIIGPLVLALLISLLQVFRQDFRPSAELQEVRKSPKEHLVIPLRERPPDQHRIVEEAPGPPKPAKKKRSGE